MILIRRSLSWIGRHLNVLLVLVIALGLWQLLASTNAISRAAFSDPANVGRAAIHALAGDEIQGSSLYGLAGLTLGSLLTGYAIGVCVALLVGYILGTSQLAYDVLMPFVSAFMGTPKIALLPAVLLVFGLGQSSAIASAAMLAFIGMVVSVVSGSRAVDSELIQLARLMGLSRVGIIARVIMPASAPFLMAGLKTALPLAMIGTVTAGFIGSVPGLGSAIADSGRHFDISLMFVLLLAIMVLIFVLGRLLDLAERVLVSWAY